MIQGMYVGRRRAPGAEAGACPRSHEALDFGPWRLERGVEPGVSTCDLRESHGVQLLIDWGSAMNTGGESRHAHMETLARGYRQDGLRGVKAAPGVAAFALWDEATERLVLGRGTPVSVPLYYAVRGDGCWFGCDLRWVRTQSGYDALNAAAVLEYLRLLFVPRDATLIAGIAVLPPGAVLMLNDGNVIESLTPRAEPLPALQHGTSEDWAQGLRTHLRAAVRKTVVKDGNTCFLLSGGADTAAIVGAARLEGITTHAVTIHMRGDRSHELSDARKSAMSLGADLEVFDVGPDCLERLSDVTRRFGTPLGYPAVLLADQLFTQLGRTPTQVVCGDGGNEIFGGVYRYQQLARLHRRRKIPGLGNLFHSAGQAIWQKFHGTSLEPVVQRAARLYLGLGKNRSDRGPEDAATFARGVGLFGELETTWSRRQLGALLDGSAFLHGTPLQRIGSYCEELFHAGDVPFLQQVPQARTSLFVPNVAIPYLNVNAIHHGVQLCFPLLERELVQYALRIPFELAAGQGFRWFMRRALCPDVLPEEIFDRPHHGFTLPLEIWLAEPSRLDWMREMLLGRDSFSRTLFNVSYVESLVRRFSRRKRSLPGDSRVKRQPLAFSLWSLLALEAWLREFRPSLTSR